MCVKSRFYFTQILRKKCGVKWRAPYRGKVFTQKRVKSRAILRTNLRTPCNGPQGTQPLEVSA